jgi:hypothetical protein
MTKEGYEYNIDRLCYFLGESFRPDSEANVYTILFDYSKLMDYYGCPSSFMSQLHLIKEDYDELLAHVKTLDFEGVQEFDKFEYDNRIVRPRGFRFPYSCYNFYVKQIDEYPSIKNNKIQ